MSHLLVLDICQPPHLAVAAGAVASLEASPHGRARRGLLHNPSAANLAACALRVLRSGIKTVGADE